MKNEKNVFCTYACSEAHLQNTFLTKHGNTTLNHEYIGIK